jgi:hypothetical protein
MEETSGSIQNWWRDVIHVFFGLWLIVSPWNIDITNEGLAPLNAYWTGGILLALAIITLAVKHPIEEWAKGLLGIWLIVSPFFLGYVQVTNALWNQLIVAAFVLALVVSALTYYAKRKISIISGRDRAQTA